MMFFNRTPEPNEEKLYAIYYKLAGTGAVPYTAPNDIIAYDIFTETLKHHQKPENHYSLHRVGTYNPKTMVITPEKPQEITLDAYNKLVEDTLNAK